MMRYQKEKFCLTGKLCGYPCAPSGEKEENRRHGCILRAAALFCVLFTLFIMCAFNTRAKNGSVSGKERENRLYPSEAEALETGGLLPTVCTPVSECYRKEEGERGFSEELLADLQECVRESGMEAAIEAYRDDTLLIDVDALLSLCPDYENLIAAQAEEYGVKKKDILADIVRIYKLNLDGEVLLVEYRDLEQPWFFLKKIKGGYLPDHVIFGDFRIPYWKHRGTAMFAEGDGYCLLEWVERDGEEAISLYYFTLRENWQENIAGGGGELFREETRYIKERNVKAAPVFYYLNEKHPLTGEIRAYVEENTYVFAGRLLEEDIIWGDEIPSTLLEEGKGTYPNGDDVFCADYDNDGEAELFWRTICMEEEGYRGYNEQFIEDDDGYRMEVFSLYGEDMPAARLWFAEFSGKTVTFEIVEPYGEAYPLLAAYLVKGDKKTPLLTCQLVYGRGVEIADGIYDAGNSFQLRMTAPLVLELEKETAQQAAFRKQLTAWIREAGRAFSVEPLQAETPFSAELLEFIREGAEWCFSGRSFSSYAAPYEVYTEKDLEKFGEELCEKAEIYGDRRFWYMDDVIYREEAQDGSVCYLVRDWMQSDYGVNTLVLYRDNGEGFEEEPVTDFSCEEGFYCGVLSYGGQRLCVIVNTNDGETLWRIDLLPLGEAGEWEHYCISFYREEEGYETLSFTENTALDGYVREEAEAIYGATAPLYGGTLYRGRGEWEEIPREIWRDIKNRASSYSQYYYMDWLYNARYNAYIPVDVDNDGEWEYASVCAASGKKGANWLVYTIYGWRDGIFTELTIDGEGLLQRYEDGNGGYGIFGELNQLWFEEIDGVTYLFTVERLSLFDGFLMRARVIQDGRVQDAGAWLFRHTGAVLQDIQEMGEYDSWLKA